VEWSTVAESDALAARTPVRRRGLISSKAVAFLCREAAFVNGATPLAEWRLIAGI